jgi:hypothetical protein
VRRHPSSAVDSRGPWDGGDAAGKVPLRLTVEEAPDAPRGSSLTGQAARHLEYPRRPRCARNYVEAVATSDIEAS